VPEPERSRTDRYEPTAIEPRWQQRWAELGLYDTDLADDSRPKYYLLTMYDYPSGNLHIGHWFVKTPTDALGRFHRMRGENVFMPIGFDAFGLPAENAAIKNKIHPREWTLKNIDKMRGQLRSMGASFDWNAEVVTCEPEYYRWNQWIFLKFLAAGLAYRAKSPVDWCPNDGTLAREQVEGTDRHCWRCGARVEKRLLDQWYLRTTKYADELLECVQTGLPGWPERVKLMQEHWLGKSEGVRFAFPHDIRDGAGALIGNGRLYVFTTRADTIMGVTFCAVAPEHPLALRAAERDPAVAAFLESCKSGGTTEAELATQAKRGIDTGLFVEHPLSNEKIALWVGNYVLIHYGDGAVMGVPAHDERDFAFARQYGIDMLQVVHVDGEEFSYDEWQDWYADTTCSITVNSDNYSGLSYEAAVDAVAAALEHRGLGGKQTTWRLRDWGISRQRYWGTPIPIVHCDGSGPGSADPGCGVVPVPEKDLPVVLPEDLIPDGSGNPLARHGAFLNVACPKCGRPARRETDTMDTFVDSAWYFMRYCDPHLEGAMVGAGSRYWMPMDQYIGGIEHAILHLLYARFWTKVMRDMKLVAIDEPFTKLLTQGMVLNHVWARPTAQGGVDYFPPDEVKPVGEAEGRPSGGHLADGSAVEYRGMLKMGKTERNGVDPQDLIDRYGADTARLFVMFAAPPEQTLDWNNAGVEGAHRFLRRLWKFAAGHADRVDSAPARGAVRGLAPALRHDVHSVLRQVSYDYDRMQYNTVVSGAMKLLNALESHGADKGVAPAALREGFGILLRVLYPVCPHTTWLLWNELGFQRDLGSLLDAPWPQVDDAALVQDEIELVLQINGKLRGSIRVAARADRAHIEAAALASAEFAKYAEGRPAKKVVVVPGRLVNIVI